jgi:hypothetical protein
MSIMSPGVGVLLKPGTACLGLMKMEQSVSMDRVMGDVKEDSEHSEVLKSVWFRAEEHSSEHVLTLAPATLEQGTRA